jgi:HlyD family secretion protein
MKIKFNSKTIIIGIITIIALIIIFKLIKGRNNNGSISFETVKVIQGPISIEVTATGALEALKTIDVGTQVSGVISTIYVDFNTYVKKGQLLAELDKTPLIASMEDAQASLDDANAEYTYQSTNYDRIKALYDKTLVAKSDFDQATYSFAKVQAGLKVAKAKFDKAKVNLGYATIYSPIDGVVLNRAVDEGQTVAASFNTPTLFSIANDLTRMQVEANIDEADIGLIKPGQGVEFTVDAFPDMKFDGKVTQVRLQPITVSNVVTYTVIVEASNPDKKLMPGMTANITITVENNENALILPYKAIRFKPDSSIMRVYLEMHQGPASHPMDGKGTRPEMQHKNEFISGDQVWVKKGDELFPVEVEIGINNGSNIEIKSGLKVNDEIVVSMTFSTGKDAKQNGATTNPFMPKPPSRRR